MDPETIPSVAREAADKLAREGARAAVLVGSRARGEAGPGSDLDLLAVGPGSYPPRLELREGLLVSTSMQPFAAHRESFGEPELLCEAVPGWRDALVLYDPEGLAASLISEAREWGWRSVERRCDTWVAGEVTARAETVQKLVSALGRRRNSVAAVKRSLLVSRLVPALAVHRRILYGSENRLWEAISHETGKEWWRAQHAALGLDSQPLEETCRAALRLYVLATDEVWHLLDKRQASVVEYARRLAKRTL